MNDLGVLSYAAYVPRQRLRKEEVLKAWGRFASAEVQVKAVPGFDEDALTMAAEAAAGAVAAWEAMGGDRQSIHTLALASTSLPYDEKVESGALGTMLGLRETIYSTEHTASTKAGGEALLSAVYRLASRSEGAALVVASDAPQADPLSDIEHALGAGAAAFVLGPRNEAICTVEAELSAAAEQLGVRFRPRGAERLEDLGLPRYREQGAAGLISRTVQRLLLELGRSTSDYRYLVAPRGTAARLGCAPGETEEISLAREIGDAGAALPLLGLVAALDRAQAGERILLVAYGSGQGCHCLSLEALPRAASSPRDVWRRAVDDRAGYIDYLQYLKLRGAFGPPAR